MTQNKNKKGIAKKALSISLVAAMLATSNVPVWASGFEAEDFSLEAVDNTESTDLSSATGVFITDVKVNGTSVKGGSVAYGNTVTADCAGTLEDGESWDFSWSKASNEESRIDGNVGTSTFTLTEDLVGQTIYVQAYVRKDSTWTKVGDEISFVVTTKEITNVNWEGSLEAGKAVYTYDGQDHKPNITSFTYNGVTYTPNTSNCDVSYVYPTDVTSVGKSTIVANITITQADGSVVKLQATSDYEIKAIDIKDSVLTLTKQFTYATTYSVDAKGISVVNGTDTLEFGSDYDVAIVVVNNKNEVGGEVLVTVTGKGNYTGTLSQKASIVAVNLSDWSIDNIADQNWTGNPVTPVPSFKDADDNSVALVVDRDYTVSYSNNIEAGTATLTVTGIGNYAGTISKTFKIVAPDANWNDLVAAITNDKNASVADMVYTGSPVVWVDNVYETGKYVMGRDFTVSYAPQNINVGTVTMTVTGLGTYAGKSATIDYEITAKNIAAEDVKVTIADIPYSPELQADAIKDAITVTYKGMTLREKNDFTFGTPTLVNGTLSVTLTGIGNYNSTRTVTKKVTAKEISTVTLPTIANKVYDGQAYTVARLGNEFVLKDGSKTLNQGTDYVVIREYNNTNAGMATIEIAGRGSYTGTATINFLITEKELVGTITMANGSPILADQDYSYTKASSDDGITISGLKVVDTDGNNMATTSYKFVYENNTAVGTATVSAVRVDNNTNVVIAQATFRIVPAQLPVGTVTLDKASYTYTGSAIEPQVTVNLKDGKYTLVEGTDYEISYTDNLNVEDDSKVIITGKGNYAKVINDKVNTTEKTFNIDKAVINNANITVNDVEYAGGIAVKEDITIKNPESGKVLVKGTDYTLTFAPNNVEVGRVTATITLTTEAAKNYTLGVNSVQFNITKKALSNCTASVENGKVVVKNGELTVPETEYAVVDNGDGSFTVTAKTSGNYTGSITVESVKVPADTTLRVTDRTISTVSLAWDKVEGAQGYTIWFRSEYDTEVSRKIINGGDITSWKQTGLQPGTKYFYTVRAWIKDDAGYVFGEQSPVQRGTTKPIAAQIKSVSATNGKVKVTLAGKAAGAEMYSMCYSKGGSTFNENNFTVGIRTQYTTRTLNKTFSAGTYYVSVKSYRDLGNNKRVYGAWSNVMKVVVK